MEDIKFIERKGGKVLLLEGRQYYKHREYKNGNVIWRCRQAKKMKCHGSVTLKGKHIIKNNNHSCKADHGQNIIDIAIDKMKTETRLSDTPVPQIYKKTVTNLRNDGVHFVNKLPDLKNIKTALYTHRNCTNFNQSSKVCIPSIYSDFILADYYYNNTRIIVFCSKNNRRLLKDIEEFFIDGTFQSCPGPFTQLYTIHGDISKSASETHVIPLIYALMTNKNQESYFALFQMIKSQTSWNPQKIHLDFEIAAANALLDIFPEIKLKKCYYHFTKALWKKAKEFKIKSKPERRIVGLFTTLPLLPITMVSEGIAYIQEEAPKTQKNELFVKYMQQTWLKNEQIISQWNVFGERHRTNNVVESWNSRLNKEVKKRLPKSLLRLINILLDKEDDVSESSERRREYVARDDMIMTYQLQLLHNEITLGHFLEKLR